MGKVLNKKYYVNNHVHMVVDYHAMDVGEVSGKIIPGVQMPTVGFLIGGCWTNVGATIRCP